MAARSGALEVVGVATLAVAALALTGHGSVLTDLSHGVESATTATTATRQHGQRGAGAPYGYDPRAKTLRTHARTLTVRDARATLNRMRDRGDIRAITPQPGYDDNCGADKKTGRVGACVFGPAWSEAAATKSVYLGANGCDTRNDARRVQGTALTTRGKCTVTGGTFTDPYTGAVITAPAGKVGALTQADHVYSKRRAWDAGANTWTPAKRQAFANDLDLEILVTASVTNNTKRAKGPAAWLAASNHTTGEQWVSGADRRRAFALRVVAIADTWGLALSPADANAIEAAL